MPHDRTRTALQRHLRGLGLDSFEVSILRGDEHRSVNVWTCDEIVARLPSLKRANKAGADIYIRGPRDVDHDLVLLDDLERFTPERMTSAGHAPAVVIETSPGNIQAWVRLGAPCPASVRHEIARDLAKTYGGDPGAVDPHQNGRLSGFTNRKPRHRSGRGFPFVLLLNAPGKPAPAATGLIEGAKGAVLARAPLPVLESGEAPDDLVTAWRAEYDARGGDLSAVDWSITHQALGSGVPACDIVAALQVVADRKGRHAADYASRTVAAACGARDNGPSVDL